MSYWGSTYMPMCDWIVEKAAAEYVKEFGDAIGGKWRMSDGETGSNRDALAYVLECLEERRMDFAEDGHGEAFNLCDAGYMFEMLDALKYALCTLLEEDWTNYLLYEGTFKKAQMLLKYAA